MNVHRAMSLHTPRLALHTGTPLAHGGGHPWHTAGGAGAGEVRAWAQGGSAGEGGRGRAKTQRRYDTDFSKLFVRPLYISIYTISSLITEKL